ncbi:MAG: NADH-quinone oxidoreductase subunit A [Gammaproteobacteria bacterium]
MNASNTIDLWPLVIYSVIVVVLISGLLVASAFLGQKTKGHATHDVYESGVEGVGSAQFRMSVPFYLTAILFIIFDLEAAFLFAWAISIREAGWLGFTEVFIFIFILLAGLAYLWRSGALEWRTKRQQHDKASLIGEGGVVNVGHKAARKAAAHNEHHDHGHDQGHGDHGHSSGAHH